ncbi:peptide ABC transporter substrate-binding protein [Bacillus pseudomycoides]|uniref:Periplasmic oligopeptide-binding protein OppA n=1 Tax=Bacillus pseudomycoides TaxID=64104 RepID=A0AA91VB78_9BACI|nr:MULTISPECIES: peptide ABC transporter substrate-binding protein [Bacillus]PEB51517.1 peptide ABC transporter substrate-binding protein [Bacillus sp. AFS098217]PED82036.1 peptide ABC transporter substrate-binding protein [Bacillus pseudomycoides]PEU16910.1 peptide ABC transporter substrate-binding protein [Bacillus sp. AFS019443]PEU20265.1 peptide ABC transporter substrate-binding protein [Bacillus sp. AFS014408]PFW57256.1 peptide ABC transporter substrate-binding protein [Bacillus sp. AFS07
MKKKVPVFVASTLAMSMLLGACSYQKDESQAKAKGESGKSNAKQVLNLVETQEIPTMDPALSADSVSSRAMNNTMEGLYRLGKDDKLVPGVAKEYKKSEDGKKYTFKLREDAKWSNGDPVTAKDFEYAWKRAINPDTAAKSAYMMYDIKNAEKINKREMAPDQLGVKATDDYTLEVELDNSIPYFVDLMVYPLFYPVNEKYVKEQGNKFGLEANTTLYNGPFVLSEWKHERNFQIKKNPSYWDNKVVKLEEVNFNIVKDTATPINLYETKAIDRATLLAEFIDKYKGKPDFITLDETSVFFLRLNEKDPALANKNIRKAISLGFERKPLVDTLLNNGSIPATGLIPGKFMFGPDKKDFRVENGDLVKPNIKEAKKYWEAGKKELGKNEIELELLNEDVELSKKTGEYLKGELEKNLPGLTVKIKQQPFAQKLKLEDAGDYVMSFSAWSADFPDPITYLDMFVTGGAQNKMGYSNPKYDEIIMKAKKDGSDVNARWKNLLEAEKMLLDDAAIAPVYQRSRAYLQRESIKDLYFHKYGGDLSFKWASVGE